MKPFSRAFYQRSTPLVAKELVGKMLVRTWNGTILAGIIFETEAYGDSNDPASHAYRKETKRNQAMFGPVGHGYIYFVYGNHHCFNIVARDKKSIAGAVLIRGLIPVTGIEVMQKLRPTKHVPNLANGPGKLCQAFQLSRADNQIDLTQLGKLYVAEGITLSEHDIVCTTRIGIRQAQDTLWRYVMTKNAIQSL